MAKKLDWNAAKEILNKKIEELNKKIKEPETDKTKVFLDLGIARDLNTLYVSGVRTEALYKRIMKLK